MGFMTLCLRLGKKIGVPRVPFQAALGRRNRVEFPRFQLAEQVYLKKLLLPYYAIH